MSPYGNPHRADSSKLINTRFRPNMKNRAVMRRVYTKVRRATDKAALRNEIIEIKIAKAENVPA